MTIAPFRKVRSDDDVIRQLQGAIDLVFQTLLPKEILDGNLLKDVDLVSGSVNMVQHKLARKSQGYLVIKKNANATIWDSEDINDFRDSFLQLRASADCTVSLWVF